MHTVLPLIDPLSACKKVIVFAYHFPFSHSDIVLTGMCWERVGAACQDMCQTESKIHLHFDIDIALQCSEWCREAAQVSIKFMHHYKQEES